MLGFKLDRVYIDGGIKQGCEWVNKGHRTIISLKDGYSGETFRGNVLYCVVARRITLPDSILGPMRYVFKRRVRRFKDLSKSQRPREKLLDMGGESLTDEELLALVINTGTRKRDVLNVASDLTRKFSLQDLAKISDQELMSLEGIGSAKVARIRAVCELGRRMHATHPVQRRAIESVEDVIDEVREIVSRSQEYLVALYLNARQELLAKEIVAIGGLNVNMVKPREIFSPAVSLPCAHVVLSHNHPSGDVQPSDADVQFTQRMKEAAELLGFNLLDHVIVGQQGYFSFYQSGINRELADRDGSS